MLGDIKAGRNDDKTNVMNMMEKYPKYKEIYERKLVLWDEFRKSFDSLEKVQQAIMIIDVVLDELEDELQNTKKRFSEDSDDYWLLGSNFTAADVYVAVLLNRLRFVGLHHHFESKPLITAYWKRLQSRPSFRVACLPSLYPLLFYFIGNQIKTYVPVVIGIGVIAAAVIYGRKYMK
uniref:Ganglioside-induced differentiation-associated protein 1-like n=1 Tax=Saccoglossus kowalevskii TaxID=10224 RepID=A0ABM0GQW7_SACKO|nr:PREDICTED: ganglioside-induced differentiation-associated protein 1-like [Saccoglossus kowalevskii]